MADGRKYDDTVFINCPFDDEYQPIFEALVFTVVVCGFRPSCARERLDSGEFRLEKILSLINGARFSIHDLSRTQLDESSGFPRFNMPLELGIDIGCRRFARNRKDKVALVFASDKYEYQKFVSDISGQDIQNHSDDPKRVIKGVRDWLKSHAEGRRMPGASPIQKRYTKFRDALPGGIGAGSSFFGRGV